MLRVPVSSPSRLCFLDADSSSDTSDEERYRRGEAAKRSQHGEEVGDLTPLQPRFVVVVQGRGCRGSGGVWGGLWWCTPALETPLLPITHAECTQDLNANFYSIL